MVTQRQQSKMASVDPRPPTVKVKCPDPWDTTNDQTFNVEFPAYARPPPSPWCISSTMLSISLEQTSF